METQDHLDGFSAALPPKAFGILYKQESGEPLTDEERAAWDDYRQRQAEAEARRDALGLVDLGEVMAGGDTDPEMLLDGLLVREKHHFVYGRKESGMTVPGIVSSLATEACTLGSATCV